MPGYFSFSLLLQVVFPLLILFTCYRSIIGGLLMQAGEVFNNRLYDEALDNVNRIIENKTRSVQLRLLMSLVFAMFAWMRFAGARQHT